MLSTPATGRKEEEFSKQQFHFLQIRLTFQLLSREAVLSLTLEIFKTQLEKTPSNLVLF